MAAGAFTAQRRFLAAVIHANPAEDTLKSEDTPCYLCGHRPGEPLFWSRDFRHDTPGRFAWNRCPNCGLTYLSPRPTQQSVGQYYPAGYELFRSARQVPHRWQFGWVHERDIRRRCRDATRLTARGRVLDVGCGTGEFLAAMRTRGWDTLGTEPNESAAAYAREQLGLDVRSADLQELELPDRSFDLVTLWTVLEHLHDPIAVLQTARRVLRPSGLLIASIPDPRSLEARCFGPFWVGYDTPRHLYVYSRDNIRSLLTRSGFAIWDLEQSQADYYTFLGSFEPWLRSRFHRQSVPGALRTLLHLPGMRTLTWPLFWGINLIDRGCIVTIYARPAATQRESGSEREMPVDVGEYRVYQDTESLPDGVRCTPTVASLDALSPSVSRS